MRAVATLGLTRAVPHTRQGATTRALKSLRVQQPSCPLGNFLPSSAEMKRVGLSFPFFSPPKLCISRFFFSFLLLFLGLVTKQPQVPPASAHSSSSAQPAPRPAASTAATEERVCLDWNKRAQKLLNFFKCALFKR